MDNNWTQITREINDILELTGGFFAVFDPPVEKAASRFMKVHGSEPAAILIYETLIFIPIPKKAVVEIAVGGQYENRIERQKV